MNLDEMVQVPIVLQFGSKEPVGTVSILKSALPPTPNWVFSLGYRTNDDPTNEAPDYNLYEVALLTDNVYSSYLESLKEK